MLSIYISKFRRTPQIYVREFGRTLWHVTAIYDLIYIILPKFLGLGSVRPAFQIVSSYPLNLPPAPLSPRLKSFWVRKLSIILIHSDTNTYIDLRFLPSLHWLTDAFEPFSNELSDLCHLWSSPERNWPLPPPPPRYQSTKNHYVKIIMQIIM